MGKVLEPVPLRSALNVDCPTEGQRHPLLKPHGCAYHVSRRQTRSILWAGDRRACAPAAGDQILDAGGLERQSRSTVLQAHAHLDILHRPVQLHALSRLDLIASCQQVGGSEIVEGWKRRPMFCLSWRLHYVWDVTHYPVRPSPRLCQRGPRRSLAACLGRAARSLACGGMIHGETFRGD
jgi:hypothetical protein